jgi:aryl sulfotransferase
MEPRRRYRTFVFDNSRWDGFRFRDDDIVISTPPKCGTTWMQMLCALLIFRTPDLSAPLAQLSPWLDMQTRPLDEVIAELEAQTHRRFIKTHTPLDGLPFDPRVTYVHVARDPREVALSWDNHMSNLDVDRFITTRVEAVGAGDFEELGITGPPPPPPDDPAERFWQWMEGDAQTSDVSGLEGLVHHAATFWERRDEPNLHLFHYGDLRADLDAQMRRLAEALGVEEPTDDLVEAATFEEMKARADELVPNSDTPFWKDNGRFFHRARSGGWQAMIGDEMRRYEKAMAAAAPPDLAEWLHDGWLGIEDQGRRARNE